MLLTVPSENHALYDLTSLLTLLTLLSVPCSSHPHYPQALSHTALDPACAHGALTSEQSSQLPDSPMVTVTSLSQKCFFFYSAPEVVTPLILNSHFPKKTKQNKD